MPVSSAAVGYRFPREVLAVAVRWYLRYGLSYRDVEELLAERGIDVDHVTSYRWVQTLPRSSSTWPDRPATRPVIDGSSTRPTSRSPAAGPTSSRRRSARPRPRRPGHQRRDATAARAFFARTQTLGPAPAQVTTDRAPVYSRVIDDLLPTARHVSQQYDNNTIEADHGRLKVRLRPMRGIKTISSLRVIAAGHAFVQNLRRGHHELTVDLPVRDGVRLAFTELARCL
jgi:transposase-like protein